LYAGGSSLRFGKSLEGVLLGPLSGLLLRLLLVPDHDAYGLRHGRRRR
jgi:hypothetical protein